MHKYVYGGPGSLGPYWEQPGRSIVVSLYRNIHPPISLFKDETRLFFPRDNESGEREEIVKISAKMTLEIMRSYAKTWSCYRGWQQAFPDSKSRDEGGDGDILDEMFDELKEVTGWGETHEFGMEWNSSVLLARKSQDL
jgi:trans-aconitate 3-methyltransferase